MRRLVFFCLCLVLPACKDEGAPMSAVCQTSLDRARSMLSVPDTSAARDWIDQARRQCGPKPPGALAEIELRIAEIDRAAADTREEKARREAAALAAAAAPVVSVVPDFIEAVVRYKDKKKREVCTAERCDAGDQLGAVEVQLWTKQKDARTFAAFATFPRERVRCADLGGEAKREWEQNERRKAYCTLTSGALKGMVALVSQKTTGAESDVTVFTPSWVAFDAEVEAEINEAKGSP